MNNKYEVTLSILSASLHGQACSAISSDMWPEVFGELRVHAVSSLIADSLSDLKLDQKEEIKFLQYLGKNIQNYHKVAAEQTRLLSVLSDVVVLKGMAAAMYYPHPEYRAMGDIDLLIVPSDFDKATKTMVDAGYILEHGLEENDRHMVLMSPSGVEIEPHIHYSSSNDEEYNRVLDEILYDGIARASVVEVGSYKVKVLPEIENGIVLLYHINHHLRYGLGLRQIIDWMMYVENCLDDSKWEEFSAVADRIGLRKLAMVTTAMCKKYLGLSSVTWCDEYLDSSVVSEFMTYIMDGGNFGRKDVVKTQYTSVLSNMHNPIQGLKHAQKRGLVNWEAARRHKWLRPFAWLYQICRWIRKGLRNGLRIGDAGKILNKDKDEVDFMKELGVTRY